MRTALVPQTADKLAKICGLFGSEHDGERASAALHADKIIRSLGMTWADVFPQPKGWQAMLIYCTEHSYALNKKDKKFIRDLSASKKEPSPKQIEWLTDVYERVRS